AKKIPKVLDVEKYADEWQRWWDSLQPEWRRRGPDKKWRAGGDATYGGNEEWGVLDRPGPNGCLSVVGSLYFWVSAKISRQGGEERWKIRLETGETKAEYEVAYGSAVGRAGGSGCGRGVAGVRGARRAASAGAGSWRREREQEQEHHVQAAGAGVRAAENRRGRSCGCAGQGGQGCGQMRRLRARYSVDSRAQRSIPSTGFFSKIILGNNTE
ncbi:hypothetical protein B0H13DRAFT_1900507, partial [Mycena leptocephala]